jgi:hypothetical protein
VIKGDYSPGASILADVTGEKFTFLAK